MGKTGKTAWLRKLPAWVRREEGSLTLEASLIFPWVFMLTLLLIPFSVAVTAKVLLHYSASVAVERTAFAWPHSSSDIRSGAYPEGFYDDLYWRLKDDALLAGLFGWSIGDQADKVTIGSRIEPAARASAKDKLAKAVRIFEDRIAGTISYRNELWKREISVEVSGSDMNGTVKAAALVTEPAELIRTFNLVRYYREKMRQPVPGSSFDRERAADVLERRR